MKVELKTIPFPEFSFCEAVLPVPAAEYERRLCALYAAAQADWVVVYADREHYANLTYLLNFDPRFEETLLVLGRDARRVLVLGNEDMGYTSVLPLPVETMLCQSLSLSGQKRATAPSLKSVLAAIGICPGQQVSVVGWKYLEVEESDTPQQPAFVPAFFVQTLRDLTGPLGRVVDGTACMIHPVQGLRACNNADQIAQFEWAARNASAAVFGIVQGARPGMSEMQAMRLMQYAGAPMTMHPIFTSGKGQINGLRSPSGKRIEYGDGVSTAVGYWGSLVCRAGMMLGEADASFFEQVAAPYFRVVATWYDTLRPGVSGGEVFEAVARAFAGSGFESALNPGHLTSLDEWVHSPIRPGSAEKIASGMAFQSDIIPTPLPAGQMMNCEDTLVVADASLRAEIRAKYPHLWARVEQRRALMREALGIHMAEELLPLSDGCAYLPPFWLAPSLVCAIGR